jgi:hypothetical protein
VKRGLFIEQSHQGQLYRIARMYVDVPQGMESLARSGSNPIGPIDVLDRLRLQARGLAIEREPVVNQAG